MMLTPLQRVLLQIIRLCRTLVAWLRRLSARPRGRHGWATDPKGHRYAQPKPHWVRREVVRLKALMPDAGCRTIAHCFNRRFAVSRRMTVGKTYVADTLRRHQHLVLEARRKLKHAVPRPVPRNLIWGCDLMVKTDQQGRSHLVVAILDHASRACLRLRRLPDKSAWILLHQVIQAIKPYGRPRFLRTDNEAVFLSRRFRWGLRLLGITPQRTDPGCPWQNGRVERFIGTVKRALISDNVADGKTLSTALHDIRRWYNHHRPHQHLQGRTPAEVWAGVDVFASRPHGWTGLLLRRTETFQESR